ncbi:hypothetical protein [Oceanicoccus sp. KOV_DT_Chl]|uniref:hypothetical protein n=1 Tax=Oceanicoccus sp. KOV_DT_Chl TaxID=1904639 RepID=UPI000C796D44|nr:hypothetical protein [Oceanicoccus sp. KOV_DT_Chl]
MVEGSKTTIVGIIGEGTFHQVHGGDTTNSNGSERTIKLSSYQSEYYSIYKKAYSRPKVNIQYIGHMPNLAAMNDVIKP